MHLAEVILACKDRHEEAPGGDESSFACDYVATVLRAQALSIIGLIGALARARELVTAPKTRVVIFIRDVTANGAPGVLATLTDRGLPCLTLTTTGTSMPTERYVPILPQPSAAFQVARWVLEQLLG